MERSRCDYSQPRYDRPLTAAITQTCKPETSACFKETSACFKETSPGYKEVSPCFKEISPCFKETSPCYKEVSPCFKETSPCIQSDFVFAHHPRTLAFGRKVRQDHFDVCHPTYSYGSCYCSTPVSYKPMCRCGSSCYCDNMAIVSGQQTSCGDKERYTEHHQTYFEPR
ncbi:unnamed protein product, partial [Rotaria sordida]